MKIALTIAGSDSGGGAGIQADLKTFHQFGVFGTSVVTAVTAQNTQGVHSVHPIPGTVIDDQLASLAHDLPPDSVKSGMLADRDTIGRVADALRRFSWPHYVLDPVMVATSGDELNTEDTVGALLEHLVPLAAVVTPNVIEAERLTEVEVIDKPSMIAAGRRLIEHGARAALITGAHLPGDSVHDVLVMPEDIHHYHNERIATRSTHGTGCTLSAAITAGLALGRDLPTAVAHAIDFVHRAIESAPNLGTGHGPLNHTVPPP
jgi:hydroxymethylpyrimidine/phosphomethylpyrimidine kinase